MNIDSGISARKTMSRATEIVATGYAYPSEVVDNDTFFERCRFPITEDRAALVQGTRMKTRYWCAEGENTWSLARKAIAMALESGAVRAEEIDVVVVSSCSTMPTISHPNPQNPYMSDLSPFILHDLGRDDAMGFDIKGTYCAGFIRGMQVMDALLENPNYRTGLLVASEQGGNISVTETNRSAFCFLFSDSAGAMVLRKRPAGDRVGIVDYVGHTKASLKDVMTWGADGRSVIVKGSRSGPEGLAMLIECGKRLLARNNLTAEHVDWLLPAQLDPGTIGTVREALGFPEQKLLWFGDVTGYSASASIPTCFAEQVHKGVIRKGDLVLSLAVGSGMNCGGVLYYY